MDLSSLGRETILQRQSPPGQRRGQRERQVNRHEIAATTRDPVASESLRSAKRSESAAAHGVLWEKAKYNEAGKNET